MWLLTNFLTILLMVFESAAGDTQYQSNGTLMVNQIVELSP